MGNRRGSEKDKGAGKGQQKQQQGSRSGFLAGPRKSVRDVQGELKRVNWPNREQLRQSTTVVIIIVLTLGVYVAALDFVFRAVARVIFAP